MYGSPPDSVAPIAARGAQRDAQAKSLAGRLIGWSFLVTGDTLCDVIPSDSNCTVIYTDEAIVNLGTPLYSSTPVILYSSLMLAYILYRRRKPYILPCSKLIFLEYSFHLTKQRIDLLERFQSSLPKEEEDHGERHTEIYRDKSVSSAQLISL